MTALYLNRMVPEKSSGRGIYETVRDAEGGDCALCGVREATTIDHYLPKEVFPALAFMPLNLVPACSKCNGFKLAFVPHARSEELLHPYFDMVHNLQWVAGRVDDGNPVPSFGVLAREDDPETSRRVRKHFQRFRLADTYSKYAANELSALSNMIDLYFGLTSPPDVVRTFLTIVANSNAKAASRNHWKAVAYKAWAQSDWFVGHLGRGRLAGDARPKA